MQINNNNNVNCSGESVCSNTPPHSLPEKCSRAVTPAISRNFTNWFLGKPLVSMSATISFVGLSVIGGLDYWNGLLEWTTGMDFDLFFSFFPQELTILAHTGLACKVVLARAVPKDSTRALD